MIPTTWLPRLVSLHPVPWLLVSLGVLLAVGCVDTSTMTETGDGGCTAGENRCVLVGSGYQWEHCVGGVRQTTDCGSGTCVEDKGCLMCKPQSGYCVGQDAYTCNSDGTGGTKAKTCRADQQCILGECFDFCDLPLDTRSNVGCEFWAVDLPNEYYCMSVDNGATCFTYGCAACQQFAVVVANSSSYQVKVTVEQNEAKPGETPKLKLVEQKVIERESLATFNLPMREVDCSTWSTDKTGKLRRTTDSQTCLSSTAYRIKATYPVVAYQFNPIVNQFSNGASLLIPVNGLDKEYLVMGWGVSNPVALPGKFVEGVPDYANVTIVGVKDKTKVDVTLTHPTQASKDGKIVAAKKGETLSFTLGPFDVLNLNTASALTTTVGDLTGTRVKADQPVAVFSGVQRASVPINLTTYSPSPPTPSGTYDVCCTEHFEQQMFPVSSLGKNFAITRTPIRSTSSVVEPDFYRLLATKDSTTVKTNLSEYPSFSLKAGQQADFWATGSFTLEADHEVMVAQYAVAQGFVDASSGAGGDPEFVVFPPVEQFRKDYIFLTPTTFTKDYVVIAAPTGSGATLDGTKIDDEFSTTCTMTSIGKIGNDTYRALHCPVKDGQHRIKADKPVGIMVYGYYSVGSYGYPGGADVKQINIK